MKINRRIFFLQFKKLILKGEAMTQSRVDALDDFMDCIEKDTYIGSVYYMSYILATTYLETAWSFRPIKEIGGNAYFTRMYWDNRSKARVLGNLSAEDAVNYCGRGFVQITGRNNYVKMTKSIRKCRPDIVEAFEKRTGQTFDLVKFPTQTMAIDIAYAIITLGMAQGIFTGKKLSHYLSDTKNDFKNYKSSRKIVNGTDRDDDIANLAVKFESILLLSNVTGNSDPKVLQPAGKGANDPAAEIQQTEAESPSGWGTFKTTVNSIYVWSGLSTGVGSLAGIYSYFSENGLSPGAWTIVTYILVFCLAAGFLTLAGYFISRQIEKFQNKIIAKEITLKELEVRADPEKYNVSVSKDKPVMETTRAEDDPEKEDEETYRQQLLVEEDEETEETEEVQA